MGLKNTKDGGESICTGILDIQYAKKAGDSRFCSGGMTFAHYITRYVLLLPLNDHILEIISVSRRWKDNFDTKTRRGQIGLRS